MDCRKCRNPIPDGAPVWLTSFLYRSGRFCCEACFDGEGYVWQKRRRQEYEAQGPRHCRNCDRPMFGWEKRTSHCSEECTLQTQYKRERERRALLREERPCPQCGETFKPKRSDGRYCSGRCRVAAFRAAKRHPQ